MDTPFPPFDPHGTGDPGWGPRLREIPLRMIVPNLITVLAICAGLTGLRLARFNVLAEREVKVRWQSEYFVGVPAPAGAFLVLLPVYLGFLGVPSTHTVALFGAAYTVLIAFLLVSRLPVWSGKVEGDSVRRDLVMPVILGVVIYAALLMSYTWEVMVVSVVAYLATLPFGYRAWVRKYGRSFAESVPAEPAPSTKASDDI